MKHFLYTFKVRITTRMTRFGLFGNLSKIELLTCVPIRVVKKKNCVFHKEKIKKDHTK